MAPSGDRWTLGGNLGGIKQELLKKLVIKILNCKFSQNHGPPSKNFVEKKIKDPVLWILGIPGKMKCLCSSDYKDIGKFCLPSNEHTHKIFLKLSNVLINLLNVFIA